jgi:hypothetical protein
MLVVNWLAQVAHHPVIKGASPVSIIGKSGHENCRNGVACVEEASIELEPRHDRHVDVGDQTGCFGEPRGLEKFGCRRKSLDRIAQRSHEPTHGLTKGSIIFNDRNEYLFHLCCLWPFAGPVVWAASYPVIVVLRVELLDI